MNKFNRINNNNNINNTCDLAKETKDKISEIIYTYNIPVSHERERNHKF
jgi:hypothetical protein